MADHEGRASGAEGRRGSGRVGWVGGGWVGGCRGENGKPSFSLRTLLNGLCHTPYPPLIYHRTLWPRLRRRRRRPGTSPRRMSSSRTAACSRSMSPSPSSGRGACWFFHPLRPLLGSRLFFASGNRKIVKESRRVLAVLAPEDVVLKDCGVLEVDEPFSIEW